MKVNEILLEGLSSYNTVRYNPDKGTILGGTTKWLEMLGATKEDLAAAIKGIKQTETFKNAIRTGLKFISSKKELVNGTLAFQQEYGQFGKADRDEDEKNSNAYVYNVYPNGQIRQYPDIKHWLGVDPKTRVTRLKSPKPRIVANDPVKSIITTYEQAINEIIKKYTVKKEKAAK